MKPILIFLAFLLLNVLSIAQSVKEFGLVLSMEGKIEFWMGKPNYNGNLDQAVRVIQDGDTSINDLRNLRYDHLNFIVGADYPGSSNLDPYQDNFESTSFGSEIYETEYPKREKIVTSFPVDFSTFTDKLPVLFYTDSAVYYATETQRFHDELDGHFIAHNFDSTMFAMKERLRDFIAHNSGGNYSEKEWEKLFSEFSTIDSVRRIWSTAFSSKLLMNYDKLINQLTFYDYEDDKLVQIITYHYSEGVDCAQFEYDDFGHLIRFKKEHLGYEETELFFTYNTRNQVTGTTKKNRWYWDNEETSASVIEKFEFTYNSKNSLNRLRKSKENEKWLEWWFEFPFVP